MTDYFSPFDYGIIICYFAALLGLGFYLQKRASASMDDYFLGGKKLPWWALGVSGMAWSLDITGTMLIVSFIYMIGPRGLFIEFRGGANLILIFMMLWTGKWHRRSGCMTIAEWNIYRFGDGPGAQFSRLFFAVATLVTIVAMIGYMVRGDGLFLATFMPFPPMTCALILIGVATVYTVVSGFYGVVITDLLQAGLILIGILGVTVLAIQQLAGYDGALSDLAFRVTGNKLWTSAVPHVYTEMPPGYEDYNWLAIIAGFYLLRNLMAGFGSGGDQRYFGARNERECGLLTLFWSCLMTFRWPMIIGFALMGLFLVDRMYPDQAMVTECSGLIKQHLGEIPESRWSDRLDGIINHPEQYPELVIALKDRLGEAQWKTKAKLISYHGTVNPERILPAVLLSMIPGGFRGLLFIALIAASISTFNFHVNWASAFLTRDIYQAYLRPKAKNRELIITGYICGVLTVVAGVLFGYFTKNIHEIWDWIIMGLGSALALPTILRLYWWRFNAGGVVVGIVVGLVAAFIQRIFFVDMDTYTKFITLTAVSLICTIIGTYATPPTDRKVLEHFYRTTRPFGFWGPFKNLLSPEKQAIMKRENFYDVICVPIGLTWQVCMFLAPMLAIIGNFQAAGIILGLWLVCSLALYKYWYKKLPPAMDGVENPGMIDGKPNYPKE